MLTHFWPGDDRSAAERGAERPFGGSSSVAEEGLTVSWD
jgi:hypothetical protein